MYDNIIGYLKPSVYHFWGSIYLEELRGVVAETWNIINQLIFVGLVLHGELLRAAKAIRRKHARICYKPIVSIIRKRGF